MILWPFLYQGCGGGNHQGSGSSTLDSNGAGLSPFSYLDSDQNQQALWSELTGQNSQNNGSGGNGGSGSTSPPVSNASCGGSLACAMVDAINQERKSNGLSALAIDGSCVQAAQFHAEDMANFNYFSHFGRDGSDPVTRAIRYGSTTFRISENIALSDTSVPFTVQLWMNSPGHRANILDSAATHTGVGAAVKGNSVYWVQCFMAK